MTYSRRALALCFATSALLWAPACSSSSDPTPQQPQATTGDLVGIFSPVNALASVTATPVGGGQAVTATLTAGTYSWPALPPGANCTSTVADNSATFLMSSMMPHECNAVLTMKDKLIVSA